MGTRSTIMVTKKEAISMICLEMDIDENPFLNDATLNVLENVLEAVHDIYNVDSDYYFNNYKVI